MKPQRQKSVATVTGKRCAIYTRKSTTEGLDSDFSSLDSQRESAEHYIRAQTHAGWTVSVERYDDGGFSGANVERPALRRLLDDIERGAIDMVVVYKVDRLSRSLLDFAHLMARFEARGVGFVSVTQNFDTSTSMGRLVLHILLSFAQFEREMIAERTKDKIAGARRRGKWTGGPVPFGYTAKNKKLVVDEAEAHIVREAFELFLQHRQMAPVARALTARGLLRRGTGRPTKHGLRWSKDSIVRLLRSPIYGGFLTSGDELHRGEHTPLIDESTFRRTQHLLSENGREFRRHGRNPDYVLRGLVRCGRCSAAMTPGSTTKNGKTFRYYRCTTREKMGTEACAAAALPASALESAVAQHIAAAVTDPAMVRRIEDAIRTRVEARRHALAAVRTTLPGKVASASAKTSKLAEELTGLQGRAKDIVAAKLRDEADRLAAAERQLAETERQLLDLELTEADMNWMKQALGDFGKVWDLMLPENRGRLMRALIANVRVQEEKHTLTIELVNVGSDLSEKASL